MVNNWPLFEQLFPALCALCGANDPHCHDTGLCPPCTRSLPWLNHACQQCGLPLAAELVSQAVCGRCQRQPPPFGQCHPLFHYRHPVNKLITRFKFHQQLLYGRVLGRLMASHMASRYRGRALPELVIPVPLHNNRLRERGFNQSHDIARICARALGIPFQGSLCTRNKATSPQLGLSATARRHNLKHAFSCQALPLNPSIALVDDVMTTGTTLGELSRSLIHAGCGELHVWCVARAHHP